MGQDIEENAVLELFYPACSWIWVTAAAEWAQTHALYWWQIQAAPEEEAALDWLHGERKNLKETEHFLKLKCD